jgi:nitrite reductase/ring-hydroxylating ferredoxin subunit
MRGFLPDLEEPTAVVFQQMIDLAGQIFVTVYRHLGTGIAYGAPCSHIGVELGYLLHVIHDQG